MPRRLPGQRTASWARRISIPPGNGHTDHSVVTGSGFPDGCVDPDGLHIEFKHLALD
jgi:hypothetical protein